MCTTPLLSMYLRSYYDSGGLSLMTFNDTNRLVCTGPKALSPTTQEVTTYQISELWGQQSALYAVKLTLKAQQRFNKSTNPEAVRNILRKYNFHGRVARRKPFISKEHLRALLEFAKSYIKKPPEFWNSVLFVDESKYNVFGSNGKQMVLRKPNSELEMKNLTPSVKPGGGSQMVWGCMSVVGVGNLHFIDGMMDKYMYLDILKQNLPQSAEKMVILPHYKLYQDNDPNNNAHICRLWALYHYP
ncbi:Transposable element Tcb1 transposase [Araneus ventricosus]|uniref:Transposable element Tcb1 transposase n=1 Tax=Araneus ventricosus TaxID=182803 RepID=A0A4Y2K2F6_ARAVE|nr:Transposable element Tcb1 transposase [Araneus ventricosus]